MLNTAWQSSYTIYGMCLHVVRVNCSTSGSICSTTLQWGRQHVWSAHCIHVWPVYVGLCITLWSSQTRTASVLVISKLRGKHLMALASIKLNSCRPSVHFLAAGGTHLQFQSQLQIAMYVRNADIQQIAMYVRNAGETHQTWGRFGYWPQGHAPSWLAHRANSQLVFKEISF